MTATNKSRNSKNRLTRAIATVAIAIALTGATYGFTTSPGRASRPGDGDDPIRSDSVTAVRKAGGTNPLEYL
jgi:hypothetical protein